MPYLNGVVTAGIAEATRVAQTVIHRAAEAGITAVSGERDDRAHAERIPEAGAGSRIARRPKRERDSDRERREGHGEQEPPDEERRTGGLVDLQA